MCVCVCCKCSNAILLFTGKVEKGERTHGIYTGFSRVCHRWFVCLFVCVSPAAFNGFFFVGNWHLDMPLSKLCHPVLRWVRSSVDNLVLLFPCCLDVVLSSSLNVEAKNTPSQSIATPRLEKEQTTTAVFVSPYSTGNKKKKRDLQDT